MQATTHIQHVRRLIGVMLGLWAAVFPVAVALAFPQQAGATAEYANASIADKALSYVGRWGGEACLDSRKPGDSGGQCRSFVNCVIWMTSHGTQNLGGRDYFRPFLVAGGTEIKSVDELMKGDIVQEGQGRHTYIIVSRVGGNTFNVVDSNHKWNERVSNYNRTVTLNYAKRAFRMGSVANATQASARMPQMKPMVGAFDDVKAIEGGAEVQGWVIDADVTRPANIKVYASDAGTKPEEGKSTTARAGQFRMDIAALYPSYGSSHGFRTKIELPAGNHVICVYGVNMAGTPGEDTKLGCRAVYVK